MNFRNSMCWEMQQHSLWFFITVLANGLKSSLKSTHLPYTMLSFMLIFILMLAESLKHNISIQL